jgi:hypothetical protein
MSIWEKDYVPKPISPDFPTHRGKQKGSNKWIEGQHYRDEVSGTIYDFIYSNDGIVRWLVDGETVQKIPKQMKLF